MNERFELLNKLDSNLYSKNSPIIISAGSLLKDKKTDNVIAQLKFQSVSNKKIIALKLTINAFDISGNLIPGVDEYQYLDLNVYNGDYFGGNKAIVMPNNITRSIQIDKLIVVFDDDEQAIIGNTLHSIPKQEKMSKYLELELIGQYQRNVSEFSEYVPQTYDDLWLCSCGTPNATNSCVNCHATKDIVFSSYNTSKLNNDLQLYLKEQEKIKNEKKIQEEESLNKQKKKIRLFISIGISLVLILVAILVINSINEKKAYNNMLKEIDYYIDLERYEEAFDMVCTYDITLDDYIEYRDKLIPLMKDSFNEIKNSSKENLAFCLNDIEYYVDSYEIYSLHDGEKTILYKASESLELLDTYYFYTLSYKRTIYANNSIYFVERCEIFDGETLDKDYEFYLKSLNLTTGKVEQIALESGYANIYCMLKLSNGSIFVAFDFWDENDGVIYNPYTQDKYEGENIIEDSRVESAIYGYTW